MRCGARPARCRSARSGSRTPIATYRRASPQSRSARGHAPCEWAASARLARTPAAPTRGRFSSRATLPAGSPPRRAAVERGQGPRLSRNPKSTMVGLRHHRRPHERRLFRPGPIVPDRGAGSARLPAVAQCTAKRRHPKRGRDRSGRTRASDGDPGAWSTRPGRLDTPLDWQGAGVNRETESTTDPVRRAVQELERRRRTETVPRRCTLSPPEAFSADPAPPEALERLCPGIDRAETGRKARAVAGRIGSSCAGWARPPTPAEFYEAVRAERPSERQKAVVLMWVTEATTHEIMAAWAQRAYTFRQLARAAARAGLTYPAPIQQLNYIAAPFPQRDGPRPA